MCVQLRKQKSISPKCIVALQTWQYWQFEANYKKKGTIQKPIKLLLFSEKGQMINDK